MQSENLKITALIPTYNREHLLSRAINSVLNQTYPPSEIIVIDDGSTDNTKEVLALFGERIRYIYQENAGSAAARHHGFSIANTEWIALLDSDDTWNPDHLERMETAIRATQGRANFYFSDTQRTQEFDRIMQWQLADFSINEAYVLIEEGSDWVLKIPQPMMLQATVIQKSAYMASGGFWRALRFRDDTHLFIKLGLKGPICAVGGGGAVMTDDDQPSNRLSVTYNRAKNGTIAQVLMFQNLIDYFGDQLTTEQEDILKLRLANAHLSLARISWRQRDFQGLVQNLMLSGVKSPRAIFDMFDRKLHV